MAEASNADVALEYGELAERFFSQPPPAAREVTVEEDWHWQPRALSKGERRAMHATLGLLALGATAALGLTLFADAIMVRPAKLGAASGRATPEVGAPAVVGRGVEGLGAVPGDRKRSGSARVSAGAGAGAGAKGSVGETVSTSTSRVTRTTTAPKKSTAVAVRGPAREKRGSVVDPLIAQARKALAGGDAAEARILAERVVQLDPSRASGYIVLGAALDALGDRAGMSTAFRKCSENARDGLVTACRALAR